jgi:hypothetical protein
MTPANERPADKRFSFSLKQLLGAMSLAALGIVALVNSDRFAWVAGIFTGTVLVLLTALLALACRPSAARAWWLGFAIFGWGSLLLGLLSIGITEPVLSDNVLDFYPWVGHYFLEVLHQLMRNRAGWWPPEFNFECIGHCMLAWVFAVIGGYLARYSYLRQENKAIS